MARLGRRRLRDYPSARVLFVDTHAPADPMWWIIGTQRSGTTWLAELVDPEQHRRVIFEPFHTVRSGIARRLGLVWGEYLPPGTAHPQLAEALDRIAEGRVRDAWTSRHNRRRFYTSRLVKDVSTTNLVPWIARRRPDDRVALVVRNPFAVVWSLLNVPWASGRNDTRAMFTHTPLLDAIGPVSGLDGWIHRADDDAFVNRMLKWCLDNTVPCGRRAAAGSRSCTTRTWWPTPPGRPPAWAPPSSATRRARPAPTSEGAPARCATRPSSSSPSGGPT